MARPDWKVEKSYIKLVKEDVQYCTMLAEGDRHFMYQLKRLSYEVKHLELPDNVNEYFNLSFYEIAVYIRINIKHLK